MKAMSGGSRFAFLAMSSVLSVAGCSPLPSTVAPDLNAVFLLPEVSPEMLSADYWIRCSRASEEPIVAPPGIPALNARIRNSSRGSVVDLLSFPDVVSSADVRSWVLAWEPTSHPLYSKHGPVTPKDVDDRRPSLNLEALTLDHVTAGWGVTIARTNLRMWPQDEAWFEDPALPHFDWVQASALDPLEPLVVLHESSDRSWLFVQSKHANGWCHKSDVALFTSRNHWVTFADPPEFLVVTEPSLVIFTPDGGSAIAGMGTAIPLAPTPWPSHVGDRSSAGNFVAQVPLRDSDGRVVLSPTLIPVSAGVSRGFLTYSEATIIRQAFKFLGTSYGWGGLDRGVDCSSLVAAVYRTMGICLPRNSGYQERTDATDWDISATDWAELYSKLDSVRPGASVHMKGHVMIYLGCQRDHCYVLHAAAALASAPDGALATTSNSDTVSGRYSLMGVVVSDLELLRYGGQWLGLSLTRAKRYELEALEGGRSEHH